MPGGALASPLGPSCEPGPPRGALNPAQRLLRESLAEVWGTQPPLPTAHEYINKKILGSDGPDMAHGLPINYPGIELVLGGI